MNKKPSKTNRPIAQRNSQEHNNRAKNSKTQLRVFSVFMLLLMGLSGVGRIATANHKKSDEEKATSHQPNPANTGISSARVLVFHREDMAAGWCEDLVISAAGDAVYSSCGKGVEKQYALSETERQQLQAWIDKFRAVNYDQTANNQADDTSTKLYLNGQGSHTAAEADTQRMIDYATTLDAKIASQS